MLKLHQARAMKALCGKGAPMLSRPRLAEAVGVSEISGTVTRILNGIRDGSSSGPAHPGLLALGFAESVDIDVDGLTETCYRATAAGREAYAEYVAQCGEPDAPIRDAASSTNQRYKID